jgi:hypothetical protein
MCHVKVGFHNELCEFDIPILHLIEMILLFTIQLCVHFMYFFKQYIKTEIVWES